MDRRIAVLGGGCLVVLVIAACYLVFLVVPVPLIQQITEPEAGPVAAVTTVPGVLETQQAIPALTVEPESVEPAVPAAQEDTIEIGVGSNLLSTLYRQLNPGVVNIQVFVDQALGGQGAGSGFILNEEGHIVTNRHVVADATQVIVVFYDGFEAEAEVVGIDTDSDLAVLRVENLTAGAHSLPLADSDEVQVGEWVVAIGNPFGLGSSMTAGIVSAVGRTIPAGVTTQFSIPQAIQTDAAINPGNSGGPLLNLRGEVVGVNAQIRTAGQAASAGVGFAIPSNVVRQVVPVLISQGTYQWPWLGIQGDSVNLLIAQANNMETQQGAYIAQVIEGGPAAAAGLRGSRGSVTINGAPIPVGGDVIVEINGQPVADFNQLLAEVSFMDPGEEVMLTIIRDGQHQQVPVVLGPRPSAFAP